jgi:superfamily II DNA/RNA helicase
METREPQAAATSWAGAGLPDILIRTLARRGMDEPFAIQSAALPDAIAGEHLLARAKTGAGKTLGFGLPVLTRLDAERVTPRPGCPRALILVPTRELATQVTEALAPLAQPMGLKIRTVVGGASIGRQIEQLKQRADVVIATPGRLTDLIERNACSLNDVRITVLDEADHMCDLGFLPAVKRLLAMVPADGQRMLFSATLDGDVDSLARTYLPNPVLVAIDPEVSAVDTMEHRPLEVRDRDAKIAVVTELAGGSKRTLVFSRTKHGADRMAKQLSRDGVPAAALHGGLAQNARTRALAAFTGGQTRVLVATDVMARGIHVDGVELVVHADPPTEAKAYLHRSGRTARAGAEGTVVVISLPEERRSTERLLAAAGVSAQAVRVSVGDDTIRDIAGEPSPRIAWSPEPPRPVQAPRSARPFGGGSRGASSFGGDSRGGDSRGGAARGPRRTPERGTWSARPATNG